MLRRPLCLLCLVHTLVLTICIMLGVPSAREQLLRKSCLDTLLEDTLIAQETLVTGRIHLIRRTEKTSTLYLKDFSLLIPCSASAVDAELPDVISRSQVKLGDKYYWAVDEKSLKRHAGILLPSFKIQVYSETSVGLKAGDYICVQGKLSLPQHASVPGATDQADYCSASSILFNVRSAVIRQEAHRKVFSGYLEWIADTLRTSYNRILPQDEAAVITAITLGDRSGITDEQTDLFTQGGIAHILAVSGVHINLLAMGLYHMLRKFRLSFLFSSFLSSTVIVSYCALTGMSVSARRCMLMFIIWCGSQILGRLSDPYQSLALAALCLELRDPDILRGPSFWLSFSCILSLDLLLPLSASLLENSFFAALLSKFTAGTIHRISHLFPEKHSVMSVQELSVHMHDMLVNTFVPGLSITLGTLPLSCYFFYQFTPWSILVNLIVLPAMSLLMSASLLAGAIGCFCYPVGLWLGGSCHLLIQLFNSLCQLERKLPGSVWVTGKPSLMQVLIWYLLLSVCLLSLRYPMQPNGRQAFLRKSLLLSACIILLLRLQPAFRLVAADVGQGDCTLVQAGHYTALIDCGSSTETSVWRYKIERMLKYYGISHVDHVFLTHGDLDHICGIEELLSAYDTSVITLGNLILTTSSLSYDQSLQHLAELAGYYNIPVSGIQKGTSLSCGKLSISCLYPAQDVPSADMQGNQNSMVLLISFGEEYRAMLMGDLEKKGEELLLDDLRRQMVLPLINNSDNRIDMLKCGHHGSKYATSDELLDLLKPSLAVLSCGKGNRYGHPSWQVLDRLAEHHVSAFRTDTGGSLVITDFW